MTVYLNTLGYEVNRKRVIRLMNQLGYKQFTQRKEQQCETLSIKFILTYCET